MKPIALFLFTLLLVSCTRHDHPSSNMLLYFDKPAGHFEESFVMGNGKAGASIFGGASSEKIYLNDITLWSGGPVDVNMNPEAYLHLPEIREALENEDYALADKLNRNLQGKFSQSYAPLGTMHMHFDHADTVENYHRELNIGNAVSTLEYTVDDVKFRREYFVSGPDQVMVIHLNSDKKEALNFKIDFESLLKFNTRANGEIFEINGYAPYHAEPSYRGNMPDAVRFDENRGTRFTNLMQVKDSDGAVFVDKEGIRVENASKATILVSLATSFNGFDKNPVSEGADNRQIAKEQLVAATGRTYQSLKKTHVADYRALFDRVDLDLGTDFDPGLPIDERLKRYAEGGEDKNLEILYFQFGRYLLISSSRTPEVPANLQGLWNPYLRPPWSSNYTMNINLEENYWLAEIANLSELHTPLLTFIENLSITGKVTARTFYGTDGWTACHNSDIWAMSNPVGEFGQGDPVWANWNMAGAWLCIHLWDHFLYTGDTSYLENRAYPVMKSAAVFCANWLIEDGKGFLITSPSTSPENRYKTPAGYTGATLYGATSDLAMIRELFIQTIEAGKVLGSDEAFGKMLDRKLDSLYPYQTGAKGHLQEWYHDWEDEDPKHRHQSHLYGLYPGNHITPEKTPELAEACRKTLEIKGDQTTGWSMGWRINLWSRLYDGNHAYKMYRQLLRYVDPSGLDEKYSGGGGTYPNLLDAHPPFQIDGNFGGSAAVIEMLMQSTEDEIRFLPAIPDTWSEGTIHGIVARGGYEISMKWEGNELIYANIIAKAGGTTSLIYKDHRTEITLGRGEKYIFRP